MAIRSLGSLQTMFSFKHVACAQLFTRVVARQQSTIPLITAADWWGKCNKVDVLGEKMSFYDSDPKHSSSKHAVVFLHGNPTSSYLWRNIIQRVEPVARCLAPDLIGMGRSSKLDGGSYRFVDHYQFLSAWFEAVNLPEKVSLVIHDWGSALGFHWSSKNEDRLEGLVHMESIIKPVPGWQYFRDNAPDAMREVFQGFRSPAGEDMILKQNLFVEQILPFAVIRKLRQEEMDAYREPFKNAGEDRRPTLTWPREIPIMGDGPDETIVISTAYHAWLRASASLPKLCIAANPGFFSNLIKKTSQEEAWPNHKIVEVEGHHYLQEDSPIQIGDHIKEFLSDIYS